MELLNEQFSGLDLSDYLREYTDLSGSIKDRIPAEQDLELIYLMMRKETEESRTINCSSCGYDTELLFQQAHTGG